MTNDEILERLKAAILKVEVPIGHYFRAEVVDGRYVLWEDDC